jgi:COP9 signalosome complex subunit 1
VDRLLFIAERCTGLQFDAFKMALKELEKDCDIERYQTVVSMFNTTLEESGKSPIDLDLDWISEKSKFITAERQRLDNELAGYRSNLIKESIRVQLYLSDGTE